MELHLNRWRSCLRLLACSWISPSRSKVAVGEGACSSRTRQGTEAASAKVMRSVMSELEEGGGTRAGNGREEKPTQQYVFLMIPQNSCSCMRDKYTISCSRTVQEGQAWQPPKETFKAQPASHPDKPPQLTWNGRTAAGCKTTPGAAPGGHGWSSRRQLPGLLRRALQSRPCSRCLSQ